MNNEFVGIEIDKMTEKDRNMMQARSDEKLRHVGDIEVSAYGETKRTYDLADIEIFKDQLANFEKIRKDENAEYVLGSGNFYQFLATGDLSSRPESEVIPEKVTNPQEYNELVLDSYRKWRESLINNREHIEKVRPKIIQMLGDFNQLPNPKTVNELRELYHKYPILNELSSVSYQDGIKEKGMINTPFVHFRGDRESGYKYERAETEMRVYLNPSIEALPKIAKAFTQQADQANVPYYFKMIDFSLEDLRKGDMQRNDRMIFYSDKESGEKVAAILKMINQAHPDWFEDRPIPSLVAKVTNGVGVADEPDTYQNEHFNPMGEKKTSFSFVRAKFLEDVWRGSMADILVSYPDLKMPDGRNLRQIFNANIPQKEQSHINGVWQRNIDRRNFDKEGQNVINGALSKTMAEVIPKLNSEDLQIYINKQIQEKALYYHINPDNLAKNIA